MKLSDIVEGDVVGFPTTHEHRVNLKALDMVKKDAEYDDSDDEPHPQEVVLDDYEAGKLTRDEAWAKIKRMTAPDQLFFWEMEINAATDLMEPEQAPQKRPSVVSRQQTATANPAADDRRKSFKVYRNETT